MGSHTYARQVEGAGNRGEIMNEIELMKGCRKIIASMYYGGILMHQYLPRSTPTSRQAAGRKHEKDRHK